MIKTKMKIIIKVLVLLLTIVIIFGCVNEIVQPKWTEYDSYNTASGLYEEPENSIEVLFLGTSVVVNGFIPIQLYEDYGICAYNLGTGLQPVLASYYWLLEAYSLHSETLNTVVFDASALRYTPEDYAYRRALDTMHFSSIKFSAILDYTDTFSDTLAGLIPVLQYHDRWEELSISDFMWTMSDTSSYSRGYNYTTSKYIDNVEEYTDISVPSYGTIDNENEAQLNEESEYYLKQMIDFCKENNITFVLTKTPIIDGWTSEIHNAIQAIADAYDIDFIDFNFSPYIEEIDYNHAIDSADGNHLNYYGAVKLTDWWGQYLSNECEIADVRKSEKYSFLEDELEDYDRTIIMARLSETEDPTDYLSCLLEENNYMIFISVKDEAESSLTDEQRSYFSSIGLSKLANLEFQNSYLAIIDDGEVIVEKLDSSAENNSESTGDPSLAITYEGNLENGKSYQLSSGGYYLGCISSCVIDGKEYSLNQRGLNIVVYDKISGTVIDAVCFDTYLSSTRCPENLELGLKWKLDEGMCFEELTEEEQTLYQYEIECEMNKLEASIDDDDLLTFLEYFFGDDDYSILISVKEDAAAALTDEIREKFASIGLEQLSDLEYGDSYIAVISGNKILEEIRDHGDTILEVQGVDYTIVSGGIDSGNESSIEIRGVEYSSGNRGLNIVIYSNQTGNVVSCMSFDTSVVTPSI